VIPRIALVGMPNVGKTALFNKLTGSNQRVANFPGVTVEKKVGWIWRDGNKHIEVIDLPGLYSLDATTLDEKVTKDFLLLKEKEKSADLFVLVLDASNLDKSLFLAFQLKSLGYPLLIALNLIDESEKRGQLLDLELFARELGAVVKPTSASTGQGVSELISAVETWLEKPKDIKLCFPENLQKTFRSPSYVNGIFSDIDLLLGKVTLCPIRPDTFSERIDRYVLHPFWGIVILISVLLIMFQMLFSWAKPLQDLIEAIFDWVGVMITQNVDHQILKSFLVDGLVSGVGSVIVFLPQIVLLFVFIQILEDLGYLGRAAFLMDSLMRKIGLPGKAVVPLLSSHACAIPGILSSRVIDNHRERLITMLVIPLTTCSARLPVYAVLIGAIIPDLAWPGLSWLRLPGITLFGLYLLGFVSALIVSAIFKKTLPNSSPSALLMELPPYRIPRFENILLVMKSRAKIFLTNAGQIILLISIIIWAMVTFPLNAGVEGSYAAAVGHFFEPLFRPLGFDWRMTTALVPSIAAREVVVSALSLVMSVQEGSAGFEANLSDVLLKQFGLGPLVALLIWFVFAPQCISTIAVLKRETNSIKWPVIMVIYTLSMAYAFAYLAKELVNFLS